MVPALPEAWLVSSADSDTIPISFELIALLAYISQGWFLLTAIKRITNDKIYLYSSFSPSTYHKI